MLVFVKVQPEIRLPVNNGIERIGHAGDGRTLQVNSRQHPKAEQGLDLGKQARNPGYKI